MRKCAICKQTHDFLYLWQPFGPDPSYTWAFPGYQYRGFPSIACCDECKARILKGEPISFVFKNDIYISSAKYTDGKIVKSPF